MGITRADAKTLQGPNGVYNYGSGPLAELNAEKFGQQAEDDYFFPKDLQNIGHWITIQAYKYEQFTKMDESSNVRIGRIRLPMPNGLDTSYNLSYNDESLGGVMSTAMEAMGGELGAAMDTTSLLATGAAVSAFSSGSRITGAALAGIATGIAVSQARRGDVQGIGALASDVVGGAGKLGQAAAAQLGVARNPHKVVLFESANFRTHKFQYKFVPQNRQESNVLYEIIKFFKKHSLPSYKKQISFTKQVGSADRLTQQTTTLNVGKHFFEYPSYFKMQFHFPHYLFEIAPCFCTDVDVNYHPANTPSYAKSEESDAPAPTAINISLNFKETKIITREDIDKNY